ncbi:hypothetical protein [Enterobacter hormaechei]|uniref:hypothetical protein n=1 Tax=Enterobacter hormaechei TaxID=158836 RepID=UPI0007996FD1|nr:hypothetical protein [Enterobacter hormaechei]CZX52107.1 Uncharacterised protein [Enterobacter hormaechei]
MTILLNALKWSALTVATVFILGWLFVWLVASDSDETTVYTENDFFHYRILTDKDIKNAPKVTDDYYFEAHSGDGYEPSNSIIFKGATSAAPLRAYLETLEYVKEKRSLEVKEVWSKPERLNADFFYLYFNTATGDIELTKVIGNGHVIPCP